MKAGGWHRFKHSLKARLVAVFLLLALATTAVFLLGMQRVLQSGWQGYAKPLVADYVDSLAAQLGTPPQPARAQALAQRLPLWVNIEGPRVQFETHPQRYPRWRGYNGGPENDDGFDWGLSRTTADGHRITFGLANPVPGWRARYVGWLTLAVLLLLTALAYAFVRHLLRPLGDIGAGVERFGAGHFDTPIPTPRRDELGALAGRINSMAASLHGMLEAKRALLLAMSHELRSPLTRARVNTELLEDSAAKAALLRDLGQMRDLITDLLESERLAAGHAALHTEPTDMDALVRECAAALPAAVVLHLAAGPVPLALDRTRMRLLLRNLLDNALRHGAGAVEVSTTREALGVRLQVRDHGPGVAPEHLAQLAQAFYRPDSARGRSTGGMGLGLFLCERVAAAHGGNLVLANAQPGLRVSVMLPVPVPDAV